MIQIFKTVSQIYYPLYLVKKKVKKGTTPLFWIQYQYFWIQPCYCELNPVILDQTPFFGSQSRYFEFSPVIWNPASLHGTQPRCLIQPRYLETSSVILDLISLFWINQLILNLSLQEHKNSSSRMPPKSKFIICAPDFSGSLQCGDC